MSQIQILQSISNVIFSKIVNPIPLQASRNANAQINAKKTKGLVF